MKGNPCLEHGCAACCYDTEMLLAEEDIRRLEATGRRREEFVERDEQGYAGLRNVTREDGRRHCVFLVDDRCSVYADRPQGCRSYPLTLSADALRVVRDVDCPWRAEFPMDPAAGRRLRALLQVIVKETTRR